MFAWKLRPRCRVTRRVSEPGRRGFFCGFRLRRVRALINSCRLRLSLWSRAPNQTPDTHTHTYTHTKGRRPELQTGPKQPTTSEPTGRQSRHHSHDRMWQTHERAHTHTHAHAYTHALFDSLHGNRCAAPVWVGFCLEKAAEIRQQRLTGGLKGNVNKRWGGTVPTPEPGAGSAEQHVARRHGEESYEAL